MSEVPMSLEEAAALLEEDGGRVPCSRYGWDSASCAPVAYAAAVIVWHETGETEFVDILDQMMGLVVNDHDDPEYLIREHGREFGFRAEELLSIPRGRL